MADPAAKTDNRAAPKIALTIGDRDWLGWTYADIIATIDAVAGSFSIGLTERWAGSGEPRPIAPGSACALSVDGEPLIAGYIDVVAPHYSATEHGVNITGRDRTGDLVDCSADPGEWHNIGMAALVASITKPFGINVYPDDGLDLGPAFPRFRVQAGETAWAAIERATRARALLAVATPDGHLALTRAKTQPGNDSPPAIILGGKKATPVKATGTFEAHERYRNYRILAQRAGEAGSAEDRAHVVATAEDTEVKRYRPLTIVAGDQLDGAAALTQVRWEANVRRGRARRASYTIAGWRDDRGRLWRPNTIVKVKDDWLRIDHELLLVSVRLTVNEGAVETDLDLADPSAYLREPPDPEREEATGKKAKKSTEVDRQLREMGW